MNSRTLWPRILKALGSIAMMLGTLDPLEGSLLILPGSGLVSLGTYLGRGQRSAPRYWLWVFMLIAVGVGALFALSAAGGFGGRSGLSIWWGLLILPYPLGWVLAFARALVMLGRCINARGQRARCLP